MPENNKEPGLKKAILQNKKQTRQRQAQL